MKTHPTRPRISAEAGYAPSPSRAGFTLVELLVVVSIIALLIAILLPSLKKARDQAKQTVCLSNMRQIGIGFTYYGDEFRQQPPPNRLPAGTPPRYLDSDWWYYFHMIPSRVPSPKTSQTNAAFGGVYACPGDGAAGRAYAMNLLASNYPSTKSDATKYEPARFEAFNPFSVRRSQEYMLFVEGQAIFGDTTNPGKYGTRYIVGQNGPRSLYEAFVKYTEDGSSTSGGRGPFQGLVNFSRHRDKANFLLCDLHVETLGKKQVVMEDPASPGKWISTLKVKWSPKDTEDDPLVNRPTPP